MRWSRLFVPTLRESPGGVESASHAIVDDRPGRPGAKFKDVELVGIPYRLVVGPRSLAQNTAELTTRSSGETISVPLAKAAAEATALITAARCA